MKTLGLVLLASSLVACSRERATDRKVTGPEIQQVVFWPKDGSVLKTGEKLFVRYRFNAPEELCYIWVTPQSPNNYWDAHTNHGLVLGNSSSPVYAFGEGLVIQAISLSYSPRLDQMGKNSLPDPPEIRVTNLFFTLRDYKTKKSRPLMTKAVDFTWTCEKKDKARTMSRTSPVTHDGPPDSEE